MPIDARIPLGAQAPEINPLATYMKVMQIREAQQSSRDRAEDRRVRDEDRKIRLKDIADRDRMREVLGKPGGLSEEKIDAITAIDPETGLRLRDHLSKLDDRKREEVRQLADDMGRAVGALETLPPEQRQAGLERMRAEMTTRKQDVSALPEQYSPEWARRVMFNALTVQQQLAALTKEEQPKTREVVTVDERGNEVTKIVDDKAGASYPRPKPKASENEPLVPVMENGVVVHRPRSEAAGKPVGYPPRSAASDPDRDDPELPRGVRDYLFAMTQKVVTDVGNKSIAGPDGQPVKYRLQDAEAELAAMLPRLKRDHPKMDPLKARKALKELFGAPKEGDALAATDPVPTTRVNTGASATKAKRNVGDLVNTRNGRMRITAVHPDGSYDADPAR